MDQRSGGGWKEEEEDTCVIRRPPLPPSPLPHPSVTGSLTQEALELCYRLLINEEGIRGAAGLVVLLLIRRDKPQPGCPSGRISQLSRRIRQHPRCKKTKQQKKHARCRL